MSEKSVIINGVDVSECKHYDKICDCAHTLSLFCVKNKNCEYKQLQRAKAENKELEKKYADVLKLAKENADSNEYCLQELEQENEQLKKSIDRIMQNKEIKTIDLDIVIENARLKQALQEIREIVSEPCIVDENCQTCNSGCMQKDILDKINEVIGAE